MEKLPVKNKADPRKRLRGPEIENLFAEVDSSLLEHFADGQVVGAAGFAQTALDAVGSLLGEGLIAAAGPIGHAVPVEVTLHQEDAGDVDTGSAGLAVVAAAAELCAQLVADFVHFSQLFLRERSGVFNSSQVLLDLLGIGHTGDDDCDILVGSQETHCQRCIFQRTTGQRLHADKADVLLGALLDELGTMCFNDVVGNMKVSTQSISTAFSKTSME